jgi:hypothetical protein
VRCDGWCWRCDDGGWCWSWRWGTTVTVTGGGVVCCVVDVADVADEC